mgnify:FL=1
MSDQTDWLHERVASAHHVGAALCISGGGSKAFMGREPVGDELSLNGHTGIVDYEPTELVITALAGTTLDEIERTVAEAGQMLAFEPPHFGDGATIGGTIACGLSGPRRPYTGSARDFVLGVKIINGTGELLSFGGQVMKNVAGYDVSRLMTGALGCLGVLTEISLKVLPAPEREHTISFELTAEQALERVTELSAGTAPLSAACHVENRLFLRLAGTDAGVSSACHTLGGDSIEQTDFWSQIREHQHPALRGDEPLWRLSVPATTPVSAQFPAQIIDWGGALRWYRGACDVTEIRHWSAQAGGHATAFRGGDRHSDVFHPLSTPVRTLHARLKAAFDPDNILNPGRLYAGL